MRQNRRPAPIDVPPAPSRPGARRAAAAAAAAAAALAVALPLSAAAAPYSLYPLLDGGGDWMKALAVSNDGLLVGRTHGNDPRARTAEAVLRTRGAPATVFTVGGDASAEAVAVSSNDLVAGNAGATAFLLTDPFLRQPDGHLTSLFAGTSYAGTAFGVNAAGLVVGTASDQAGGLSRAFFWKDGVTSFVPLNGVYSSVATAVNDSGMVVGYANTRTYRTDAWAWNGAVLRVLPGLGDELHNVSYAHAVAPDGVIVGSSADPNGVAHACAWRNSRMSDLGGLVAGRDSVAYAINAHHVAAGAAIGADFTQHAVLFHDGIVDDLNKLVDLPAGVHLDTAVAINDAGVVVVEGTHDRKIRNFLLVPAQASPAPDSGHP